MTARSVVPNVVKEILSGMALVVGIGLYISSGHTALAEPLAPTLFSSFQTGMVTDLYNNNTIIEIDHRSYKLSSDSFVIDARGRRLEPPDLVVQAEVKFQVKKESRDTIDKMVVFFPR